MNEWMENAAQNDGRDASHGAFTELCQHLEHGPSDELLSDYTATLIYAMESDERAQALDLLRSQLFSRKMTAGRVQSWYVDCGVRIRQDPEGFVTAAQQEHVRRGLAAEADAMAAQKNDAAAKGAARLLPASAFAAETADYLIDPYLPRGMLSILGGVSGAGKTSLALDITAAVSRGERLGFEEEEEAPGEVCTPGKVFYLTAENDANKVLRPRLERLGADLDRVFLQAGASFTMREPLLWDLCRAYRPDLLVFDPIQSFLGPGVQMNRAEQVRPIMDQLIALAKELDMAVLLISHMSKPGPGVSSALDRLLGSSDFRNSARSILIAGADPENPGSRVFAHAKNSLGPAGPSQRYRIGTGGTVTYEGPCSLSADRIICSVEAGGSRVRSAPTLAQATRALDGLLSFVGWVDVREVYRVCEERGFSDRTMRNAKQELQLKTLRLGKGEAQKYYWFRPDMDLNLIKADILNQNEQLPLARNA